MTEDINIEKEYNRLARKHKLPDFNELNDQFELSGMQNINEEFLIRYVRRRMNEKVVFFTKILEVILHPNSNSLIYMHENKFFDEQDKEKCNEILRDLMKIDRESLRLDVEVNEKGDVDYIKEVNLMFPKIRDEVLKITKKMKEAWAKKEDFSQEDYFG